MTTKISSGSQVIDDLLNGGFENGIISTLYGPAGSGKSNISMLACVTVAKSNKKVIYVDTEGGFSIERVKQIEPDEKILNNIILISPTTFDDQQKCFTKIRELIKKEDVALIVVDSIVMLYRLEMGCNGEVATVNKELARQLSTLSGLARNNSIAVLVTNQVYADFNNKNNFHMVGGDLLKYWSKAIIKLDLLNDSVRIASIDKHRSIPENKKAFFKIEDKGLFEIKEKKFSLF